MGIRNDGYREILSAKLADSEAKELPKSVQGEIAASLREAGDNTEELSELAINLERKGYQSVSKTIEKFIYDVGNYRAFPAQHWKKIRTTNGVERINKERKRRIRNYASGSKYTHQHK